MSENRRKSKKAISFEVISIVILFLAALVPRVSSITTGLTWDESAWISRSSQFISAIEKLNLQEILIPYHPGVTTMWIGGIALRLKSLFVSGDNSKSDAVYARFSIALVTCMMILGIYFLTRKLFNRTIAFLGALLMALDPFYIAHSRLIHVEALVANFMVLSVLSFLVYLQKGRSPFYGILSGILGGAACLTKTTAFFLFPFTFFILLLHHWLKDRKVIPLRLSIRMFLGWVATSLLTFCVLWPRVWIVSVHAGKYTVPIFPLFLSLLLLICYWGIIKQPIWERDKITTGKLYRTVLIGTASILVFASLLIGLWIKVPYPFHIARYLLLYHPNETPQVFLGKTYLDPGPFYFTVVLIMRTPPLTLILLTLSILYFFHGKVKKDFRWSLLALWLYVILFDVAVSVPVKKLPRYILPAFPAIDILAAFALYHLVKDLIGMQRLFSFINKKLSNFRWITNTTVLSLFIYSIPVLYQLSSGLSVHPYYLAYYSPIWGGRANAPNVIKVGRGEGMDKVQEYLDSKKEEGVEYKVLYVRSASAGVPEEDVMRYYVNEIPEHVVKLGGIEYAWIYRKRKEYRSETAPSSFLDETLAASICFSKEVDADKYKVSDSELLRAYRRRSKKLRLGHVWVKIENKALVSRIVQQLRIGADIETMAKYREAIQNPKEREKIIFEIKTVTGGDMVNELEKAAYSLKLGQVKVVKTKSGYHILKLLDKMIRQRGSFDAERADIMKRLRRAKLEEDIGLDIDRMKGEENVQR